MATYNGMAYIGEQLESLGCQARLPDELVICDEGSTDGSIALIERFAASAPFPIKFHINPERLGLARNFERAARMCSGDLIFFCDQDDVWLPEKLAVVEQLFAAQPAVQMVINDAKLTHADLTASGATQLGNILRTGWQRTRFVTGCCSAHRRDFHDLVFPIPDGMPVHDLWVNGLANYLGCSIISDQVLQLYRRHGANESQWYLSDPEAPSQSSVLRAQVFKDSRMGWRQWVVYLTLFIERLEKRGDVATRFASNGDLEKVLLILRNERARLERRILLCGLPRWRRTVPVLRFQLAGGYRDASGWLSAAKDMVRR